MMAYSTLVQNPSAGAAATAAQARGAAEAARAEATVAREGARVARDDARQAARDAAQDAREARGEAQPFRVTVEKDGKTTTLEDPTPEALNSLGVPILVDRQSEGPFVIAGMSIVATALLILVSLILRHRARTRVPSAMTMPTDLVHKLERMEAGIESVAVEVERISEGQRFTARLLSDRVLTEVPRG
jgi:hypothetical protein